MADSYKISLGIDFNDGELKNIKKQLTNLTDNTHRVRIDIDNSRLLKQIEHAKKELKELNSAKGNQPSLTVNTQSLEKSLSRVADVIEEVRKSLGTLDDKSGMKSLLSSVNQIATALGKVENESDNLVKSLSALSKKDFSINFDLKMGKSASQISSEQGDIKRDAISQLKQQAKALEDYLDQYYKVAQRQEGVVKLTQGTNLFSSFWEMSPNIGNTKASLKQQVSTYKQYIDLMQEAAKIKGVDLSSVTSGFSKTTNDIVEETKKVSDGAEEVKQAFKGIFGGSLDIEGLSGQLQPIITDLGEIKTALQSLSSNNAIDGLTQSFNRLSETLEKLTSNLTLAKNTLDTGFSNTAPANNAVKAAQQTGQKIGEAITQSAKEHINLDDVVEKETRALMKEYGISAKNKTAKDDIKGALTNYVNEIKNGGTIVNDELFGSFNTADAALRKVTDTIARHKKEVIELDTLYEDLLADIKSVNKGKGATKVRLSDMRAEWGDDYKANKDLLGSWFSDKYTDGIGIDSWVKSKSWSSLLDLSGSHQDIANQLVELVKKAKTKTAYSGDELFKEGFLNIDDVEASVKESAANISAAEQKMAQSSTAATDTIVRNQQRQQGAYENSSKTNLDRIKSELEQAEQREKEIDRLIKDNDKRFQEATISGDAAGILDSSSRMDELDAESKAVKAHIETLKTSYNQLANARKNITQQISGFDDAKQALKNLDFNTNSLDKMIGDFEELGVTVKKVTHSLNKDGSITFNVEGIDKAKNIIKAVKTLKSDGSFGGFSSSVSQDLKASEKFLRQQKNAVSDLTNTINQLNRSAIDPNAGKPIKDDAHLQSLSNQYKLITDAIEKMGRASNDNDFQEERNNVKALISEYKSLTREYKNAETSATSFRSKDIGTIKSTNASDLDVLIQKMKDAGVYTAGFEKGAENLRNVLNSATDTSGINAFLNGFDKLEAGYKRAAQYAKSSEKATTYGKRAQGLAESIKNIQRISPEINEFEVEINGAKVSVESLLKSLSQVKTKGDFDSANEDLKVFKKSAEAAGIAIRETAKEANSDFNKLKSLAKEMGKVDVELAKVDNVDDFNSLKRLANDLEAEYKDLYDSIGKNLNADQLRELDQIFANTTDEVRELNNELSKSAETKELTAGFERLKTIAKEINGLKIDIFKFEDADNIEQASNQLNELENEAAELRATLQQKFNIQSFDEIDNITRQGEEALNSLIAKAEEAKAKLAKSIKVDIDLGNFDNEMDTMIAKFNSLSDANDDLRRGYDATKDAYKALMDAADANTGDEVADRERLIQAEKEYAAALEKTNNLIKKQARADKIDADKIKLQDNRELFQGKIDVWMEKNSAATKKFGAHLLDLRAKAETADQAELNHLEKELLKVDKAADKAGLKMQSLGDQIKSKFKEYMAYFSVAEVFMYVEQGLREMFNTVKEIDTAMTGLYRVTDLTASQYDTLFNNMISSAKEYGATLNDIINATTDWVRAGFDADVALGMAEVTTMYQHISDLDYDTAAENLITAYNGFKNELLGLYDGDEVGAVRYIADILNELDKQNCP